MNDYLDSIKHSINTENWYACLIQVFTLPDIVSNMMYPELSGSDHSKARYLKWFNENLAENYIKPLGPSNELFTFLSADDFYALRCALLHEGRDKISSQRSRKILDRLIFRKPTTNFIHSNYMTNKNGDVELDLDILRISNEIHDTVEKWWLNLSPKERSKFNESLMKLS